jgi:hypothetical protein
MINYTKQKKIISLKNIRNPSTTYMRQTEMDQKLKEKPQKKVARVHIDNPTPISLNGFTLQNI